MKDLESLAEALAALKTTAEIRMFLRDLLTEGEIVEFNKRWQAAQMLHQGISYKQVEQTTGLSSTTVARVSKWLQGGAGGYQLLLKRQER